MAANLLLFGPFQGSRKLYVPYKSRAFQVWQNECSPTVHGLALLVGDDSGRKTAVDCLVVAQCHANLLEVIHAHSLSGASADEHERWQQQSEQAEPTQDDEEQSAGGTSSIAACERSAAMASSIAATIIPPPRRTPPARPRRPRTPRAASKAGIASFPSSPRPPPSALRLTSSA